MAVFRRLRVLASSHRLSWLALGACAAIVLWSWFIYNAIFEWRRSSALLAERRASVAAHLLLEAIVRDMRGVQENVLPSSVWEGFSERRPYEHSTLVASAFARYPYPESFFVWQPTLRTAGMVFFNRSDRLPPWVQSPSPSPSRFPVVVGFDSALGNRVLDRILEDANDGRRYSAFELDPGGVRYQIIAEITYADEFREEVIRITGFTVNLSWVRDHYFAQLTHQVAEIGGEDAEELSLTVFDDAGQAVVGVVAATSDPLRQQRQFPLAFFDPAVMVPGLPANLSSGLWTVEVSASTDPTLLQATRGSNRTLMIAATAAAALLVGVILTIRAERASIHLSELRAEFVASVTHELKTPIASIRAGAETLKRGRVEDPLAIMDYSSLIVAESKRLSRLVENLLVHSRMADVTSFYTFEPIDLVSLFDDIGEEFRVQLVELGFEADVVIPTDLPRVIGDELSLRLLFDNLIDNAIKYSGANRWIGISARVKAAKVYVDICDRGIGIAEDEQTLVLKKFVRGRHAPHGGSGLGLAIVSRIVRDHGGTLVLGSNPAGGTIVTVGLRMAPSG